MYTMFLIVSCYVFAKFLLISLIIPQDILNEVETMNQKAWLCVYTVMYA